MSLLIALSTALMALIAPLGVHAQEAPEITGPWTLTFETPRGEQSFDVEFEGDGEELAGTLTLPRGQSTDLSEITFTDGVLAFTAELGQRGMKMRFEGTLEDGVVKGEMEREGGPAMGARRGGRGGGQGRGGDRPGPGPRAFEMTRAGG